MIIFSFLMKSIFSRQKTEFIHRQSFCPCFCLHLIFVRFFALCSTSWMLLICCCCCCSFTILLFINVSLCASLRLFYCYCHLPFAIRTYTPCSSLYCVICSFDSLLICVHEAATNFWARIKHIHQHISKWRFTFSQIWFVSFIFLCFFRHTLSHTFRTQHTFIIYFYSCCEYFASFLI